VCGLVGLVSTRPARFDGAGRRVVAEMTRALVHRGPDDEGIHVDPPREQRNIGCILGFRRLSILDLAHGHQPMVRPDGAAALVFNGEIYDHLDRRGALEREGEVFRTRSDTETLLALLARRGEAALDDLTGMFALALWDARAGRVVLARDRFGKKPLYWTRVDGGETLIFASEIKALLCHPEVLTRVDPAALRAYLFFDYVPSPDTILAGVRKLEPGSRLLWSGGEPDLRVLWRPRFRALAPVPDTLEAASDLLAERLRASVARRLVADVPLGVFLSGGIDSSLLTALMCDLRPSREVPTFAIGVDDPSFDESQHARAVARALGTDHHERRLDPRTMLEIVPNLAEMADEPINDPSLVPTSQLAAFAREHVTVALGGDGGDELFLGYPTFIADNVACIFDYTGLSRIAPLFEGFAARLPTSTRNVSLDFQAKRFTSGLRWDRLTRHFVWLGAGPPALGQTLIAPDLRERSTFDPAATVARFAAEVQPSARGPIDTLTWLYLRLYLGEDILVKVDRATMAHALEARAPFLDPGVVDFALALAPRLKQRGLTLKRILRHLAARRLPRVIARRPKKGFGVPVAAWLKGPLRPWMEGLLDERALARSGLWHPPAVRALVQAHLGGRADHRKLLWAILMMRQWEARWLA